MLEWSFFVHTLHRNCEITEFMKSSAKKQVALFVNRSMPLQSSMHDIEIPAQKHHAHNGAPCSLIE